MERYVIAWRNLKTRIEIEMVLSVDVMLELEEVEQAIYRLQGLEK